MSYETENQSRLKTATFFFSDIEGSTKLLQTLKDNYGKLLHEQQNIVRNVSLKYNGEVSDTAGDGFFIVFESAMDAVKAAVEIQTEIRNHQWVNGAEVKLRIGIHTGEANINETGYIGLDVHIASRIMSAGHGRQILISDTVRSIIENRLNDELSIEYLGEYSLKDLDHSQKIYQLNYSGSPDKFPQIKSNSNFITNLPSDLVKLIGREKELSSIKSLLLNENEKLITITGPGGIGKTSLALEACAAVTSKFTDGVYTIFLANVLDSKLVADTISGVLGLNQYINSGVDTLIEYLKSKNILLLLDNFEQVTDAATVISSIISTCPGIKIMVTSRIPLKIKSETEFRLTSLELPTEKQIHEIENLSHFASIELFIERAKRIDKNFEMTKDNAAAIAEICIRLDGLPLAIELACVRIKIFSPQQLLSKLSTKLNLLKGSETDRPERHKTMRKTIQWSYDLLEDNEKILFKSFSVFSGGAYYDAVVNIFGDMFEDELGLIDLIQSLVEKNLIKKDDNPECESRFYMLETIHEFASEIMDEDISLKNKLSGIHAQYFLSIAEEAEKHLTGKNLKHWLDIIEADVNNIKAAIRYAEENNMTETALKFCSALWRFWIIRGNLSTNYKQVKSVLSMPFDNKLKPLRASVLNGIGTIIHEMSNYRISYPLIEESLKLYKELNDVKGILTTLVNLSWVSVHLGELDKALILSNEAEEINKNIGDKRVNSLICNNLGWLYIMRGNFPESRKYFTESYEMRKQIEDNRGLAFAIANLGWVETFLGNYTIAENHFNKSLKMVTEINDKQLFAWVLSNYGYLELTLCKFEESYKKITEALNLMKQVLNEWVLSYENLLLGIVKYFKAENENYSEDINKAFHFFNEAGSKWGAERTLISAAMILADKPNLTGASDKLSEAIGYTKMLNDNYGIIQILESYALIMLKKGDTKNSAEVYSAAFEMRKKYSIPVSPLEMRLHSEFFNKHKLKEESILTPEEALRICKNNTQ